MYKVSEWEMIKKKKIFFLLVPYLALIFFRSLTVYYKDCVTQSQKYSSNITYLIDKALLPKINIFVH